VYGRAFTRESALATLAAFVAFGFASSACYVVNDILDAESDRAHPRKRTRPIAARRIAPPAASIYALLLAALAALAVFLIPGGEASYWARELTGLYVALYVLNVLAYSAFLKNRMVADVISLSLGFVLRVLGGCAAVAVIPSPWLLNVTFFLSMFLAFGKRLGERRSLGASAAAARTVHSRYTDELLRMLVVVTGVAALLIYAVYVQDQAGHYTKGFNLLWLTMLPATYGLMRAMVKVETGEFDDPTEMAVRDRPFQLAGLVFAAMTVALLMWRVRTGS
jgi:4-hydroxybenzoate polyprenyltransferase